MIRPTAFALALILTAGGALEASQVPGGLPPPPTPTPVAPAIDPTGSGDLPGQAPRAPGPNTKVAPVPAPLIQPPAREPAPRKARGRDVNVQVELTITDQVGSGPGEKRVVSMVVADAAFGRIRSGSGNNDVRLNVDARPEILDNDRILVELTVEHVPPQPEGASKRPAGLNEMLTVILQNGKPMQISQAADPITDRKMTVEVRASIVK